MGLIATITGEGYTSEIWTEILHGVERGWFQGNADVDADGANGQNGKLAAYRSDGRGFEALANGGLALRGGKLVVLNDWAHDIVLFGADGLPIVTPDGSLISTTAYKYPDKAIHDPSRYVDAASERYIVVPPVCLQKTAGAVLGCHAIVTNLNNGKTSTGFVGDVGPRTKDGEMSMAMAQAIGLDPDPRAGGESRNIFRYEFFPGKAGMDRLGRVLRLQRSNGTYV